VLLFSHSQDIAGGSVLVRVPLRLAITDVMAEEEQQRVVGHVSGGVLLEQGGGPMLCSWRQAARLPLLLIAPNTYLQAAATVFLFVHASVRCAWPLLWQPLHVPLDDPCMYTPPCVCILHDCAYQPCRVPCGKTGL
jgi:hypothetical protein